MLLVYFDRVVRHLAVTRQNESKVDKFRIKIFKSGDKKVIGKTLYVSYCVLLLLLLGVTAAQEMSLLLPNRCARFILVPLTQTAQDTVVHKASFEEH